MLIAINAKLRETSLHQQPLCQSQRSARCYRRTAHFRFNQITRQELSLTKWSERHNKNHPWVWSFGQKWRDMWVLSLQQTLGRRESESTEKVVRSFLYCIFFIHRGPVCLSLRVIEITTKWLAIILRERKNKSMSERQHRHKVDIWKSGLRARDCLDWFFFLFHASW